ncbi:tumor necrosis factor receptor superfamily member 17 [Protopterus annectens]|uniref:tumor necrosis factor receptor superfamily member 17 n=1 Tax=Protopterus annectens TaxID=7888 RepID=UPI001CFC1ADF|nr:tumor necrosis factor receptor superfamily member 17 [Protopterus annectens]
MTPTEGTDPEMSKAKAPRGRVASDNVRAISSPEEPVPMSQIQDPLSSKGIEAEPVRDTVRVEERDILCFDSGLLESVRPCSTEAEGQIRGGGWCIRVSILMDPAWVGEVDTATSRVIQTTETHWAMWVILGTTVFLVFMVIALAALLQRLRQKTKNAAKETDPELHVNMSTGEGETLHNSNISCDVPKEFHVETTEETEKTETAVFCQVEICTCQDEERLQSSTSVHSSVCDTSFPLPATEEGATVLVTTKTNEYCSNTPNAKNDAFLRLWTSIFGTY